MDLMPATTNSTDAKKPVSSGFLIVVIVTCVFAIGAMLWSQNRASDEEIGFQTIPGGPTSAKDVDSFAEREHQNLMKRRANAAAQAARERQTALETIVFGKVRIDFGPLSNYDPKALAEIAKPLQEK